MKKRIFSMLTSFVMVISLVSLMPTMSVGAVQSGDYMYRILENDTAEIIKYLGNEESVVVPETLDGYTVTSIGFQSGGGVVSGAFENKYEMESVVIPDTVTNIGDYVFCGCEFLNNISIPDSVTAIGELAFFACRSFENILIPSSVTSIGDAAFGGCYNLTIKCYENSVAHQHAVENGIKYELITPFVPLDEFLGSDRVIWEGDKTLNSFDDGLFHLGLDNIFAEMGNRLYVYAYPQEDAEIQFVGLLGENKIWTPLTDDEGNETFTFDENGKLKISLTAEMAYILEECSGDIYIRGNNLRIYRMAIQGIGRTYNDIIRYQVSEDQSKLRYVWEVDEEVVEKANSGYITLDVSPDADSETISNTTAITKAYRSIYANGEIVTAPEGRVFIISPVTENLTETTSVTCRFKLDSLGGTHERAYKEPIYWC